jgi:mRNA interferase RelE/StbE
MEYTIIWTETSKKTLEKLQKEGAERIIHSVHSIRYDPFRSVDRLAGSPWFKYRVGKYRVILDIRRDTIVIFVLKIGQRKKVYKDL